VEGETTHFAQSSKTGTVTKGFDARLKLAPVLWVFKLPAWVFALV